LVDALIAYPGFVIVAKVGVSLIKQYTVINVSITIITLIVLLLNGFIFYFPVFMFQMLIFLYNWFNLFFVYIWTPFFVLTQKIKRLSWWHFFFDNWARWQKLIHNGFLPEHVKFVDVFGFHLYQVGFVEDFHFLILNSILLLVIIVLVWGILYFHFFSVYFIFAFGNQF
jgi:hypothetical protein